MKIKFLHNVFSVAMAFLVMFSTLSFTVESHYCGPTLIDVSIFTEAEKCTMEAFEKEQERITKKSCCKDEVEVVEGQKELKHNSFNDLNFNQQFIFASFIYSYINLFESLPKQTIPHKDYSPPILIVDIQVLDETFLI